MISGALRSLSCCIIDRTFKSRGAIAGGRRAAAKEPAPPPEDEEGVVDLLDSDDEEGAGELDAAGSDDQGQASYSAEQSQVRQAPPVDAPLGACGRFHATPKAICVNHRFFNATMDSLGL